jgi:phospholipid/cholesterol/gamma-HCH transport system substrate-binding protein
MITRTQKVRLGLFITVGCTVILIAVATLSYDRLFSPKHIYYIAYTGQSLSGIDIGSQVKYLGIPVGTVRGLTINPENPNEIIVTIAVDPDTPIREDVEADIATIGITGLKMIELTAGSPGARELEPESFITPGRSITDEFIERAASIADKIELVLDNMLEFTQDTTRERIISFIDEAHATITRVNKMIDDNQERMERTVSNVDTLAAELNEMVGSLNALVRDTQVLFNRNRLKVDDTLDDLNNTVQHLNNTARMVNSDPSILIRGVRPKNPPDDRLR